MDNNKIRLLRAEEIECRIATINENGLSLLLYKDARVDQKILDESFGLFGWQRHHQSIDGNLYCVVSILNKETGEWIEKQDVGAESYGEKEKGKASDSFKRACFNVGIGRELYSAPFIWIPASKVSIQKKGERYYCKENFMVHKIGYSEDREINELVIVTNKGKMVFEMKSENSMSEKDSSNENLKEPVGISQEQLQLLDAELERTGVDMETVKDRYHFHKPDQMSEELYSRVMKALAKTKSAKAA